VSQRIQYAKSIPTFIIIWPFRDTLHFPNITLYIPRVSHSTISLLVTSRPFKGHMGGSVRYEHQCRCRSGLSGSSVNRQETCSLERLISRSFLSNPPALQNPQRSVKVVCHVDEKMNIRLSDCIVRYGGREPERCGLLRQYIQVNTRQTAQEGHKRLEIEIVDCSCDAGKS
jgi:hypothetical protein